MEIQRPLHWHQGLFLQPQHFQLLERSLLSFLAPFHEFGEPHFWGTFGAETEKAALGRKTFSLGRGSFLFPDGSYAVLNENAVIESRPFEEAWVEGGKPFGVYVGLKRWNEAGENVTSVEKFEGLSQITTRFVTLPDPEEAKDLHSGGPPGQLKKLSYLLKLFWETELDHLGDYLLLRVGQLERVGEEVRLSERFIPPSLTLGSSEVLLKIVKEIRDQVTARAHNLEEYKAQRGIQTAEFGTRDMVYLLALRSLTRYVPVLFHYTEALQVHPWAVFGSLRQLIGELSSFSERVNVLAETEGGARLVPLYDHHSLWECFSAAQTLIAELLDEITAGPEYIIKLIYDGTYYAAQLSPAIFAGRSRYFIVCRTEADPKFVLTTLTTIAKLSSREYLPILIARALPGLGLEHLQVPPQELPRRAHTVYFAVDSHSDQWALVEKSRNIALYWDNAPDDLEVELMVVQR